jgi:hypothetical protein
VQADVTCRVCRGVSVFSGIGSDPSYDPNAGRFGDDPLSQGVSQVWDVVGKLGSGVQVRSCCGWGGGRPRGG